MPLSATRLGSLSVAVLTLEDGPVRVLVLPLVVKASGGSGG